MDLLGVGKALAGAVDMVADKFFVDAKDKEAFKLKSLELQQQGEFKAQEIQLSAILAKAKSADPWTSRARPSFLYVMYIMIIASIPLGVLSVFKPDMAVQIAAGMKAWLSAIPDSLWTVFGLGYLGYTGARSFIDKKSLNK